MKSSIFENVTRTDDCSIDRSVNFVALAIKYNSKKVPAHAGIAICCDKKIYIFHFDLNGISLLEEPNDWFIQKPLSFLNHLMSASFFNHCNKIYTNYKELKGINPSYGFYYEGEYFKDGKYYTENNHQQFMTCVGFCLAVITGGIESDQYIKHEDWVSAQHESRPLYEEYMEGFLEGENDAVKAHFKNNSKRISPLDYFTTAFCKNIPVTLADVNKRSKKVNKHLIDNFLL